MRSRILFTVLMLAFLYSSALADIINKEQAKRMVINEKAPLAQKRCAIFVCYASDAI